MMRPDKVYLVMKIATGLGNPVLDSIFSTEEEATKRAKQLTEDIRYYASSDYVYADVEEWEIGRVEV